MGVFKEAVYLKILLVKSSSAGDLLHTYPVVDYLIQKIPGCQIDWVVEERFADLVERHPHIHRAIQVNSKRFRKAPFSKEVRRAWQSLRYERYDLIVDLQGNCKSLVLLWAARGKKRIGFGRSYIAEWPALLGTSWKSTPPSNQTVRQDLLFLVQSFFDDEEPFEAGEVLLQLRPSEETQLEKIEILPNALFIAPGSRWPSKRIREDLLTTILQKVPERPLYFLYGSEEEKRSVQLVQTKLGRGVGIDPLPLALLQHLLRQGALLLAADSLILHLASTVSLPTLSFFGPSNGSVYAPSGDSHSFLQGECPYGKKFPKRCPLLRKCEAPCMEAIDPDQVVGWIRRLTSR